MNKRNKRKNNIIATDVYFGDDLCSAMIVNVLSNRMTEICVFFFDDTYKYRETESPLVQTVFKIYGDLYSFARKELNA